MITFDELKSKLPWDFSLTLSKEQLYAIGGLVGAGILLKVYVKLTSGRHEIKQSLDGQVVIITGGTAGIGKETARQLAKHGATVHILARDMKKADTAVDELKKSTGHHEIYVHHVDLSDFSTVRAFVDHFLATDSPIHMLINNAGLVNPTKVMTTDGLEQTIQVNHLSHFLLTNLLLDRIVKSRPSRIVNVSSDAHFLNDGFDVKDLKFEKTSYDKVFGALAYGWSKLANLLFTRELARRLYGKGVSVNAVHPGCVGTEVLRSYSFFNPFVLLFQLSPFRKSAHDGAQTTLYAATAEELANVNGHYFVDCRPAQMHVKALDDKLASELWKESEKLTGLVKSSK